MPYYEAGVLGTVGGAGAAIATIHGNATNRARIEEIGVMNSGATGGQVTLIRPSNTPVATTSLLGTAVDLSDQAATVNVDTAWSTAPTVGTGFLRRGNIGAAAGSGFIWTWPKERRPVIDKAVPGLWLVLWAIATITAPTIWVVWEE